MKSFAKFLTGITLVVALLITYYILSSRLYMQVDIRVVPARERAEDFAHVKENVDNGLYGDIGDLEDIDAYYFASIVVKAKNYSLFSAEWAELSVRTIEGDVMLFARDIGPKDIGGFGADSFEVTLLTRASEQQRSGWLEYYIFGRQHTLEVNAGQK